LSGRAIAPNNALTLTSTLKAVSLLYHDVVSPGADDTSGFPGILPRRYKLTWDEFRSHLDAISSAVSTTPVLVPELADGSSSSLLLTFDDGGASALAISRELAGRGWRGHFFVTVDYIGTKSFLSRDGIRELDALGHAVGSHSCSHPDWIARCTWAQLLREWGESRSVLSEIVGHEVSIASVPGGHYSRQVGRAAAAAGITALFTSEPRVRPWAEDGCLVLGRYTIQRGTPAATAADLAAGRLSQRARQLASWNARKAAKAVGGPVYTRVRSALIRRSD
jgi:peptidoglycan/xylan/chitin deacetylase (PgdA/CDA1 family)